MSKSVKDYKSRMDSIPISESFIRRTEEKMKDALSVKITEKSAVTWQRVIVTAGSLAACIAVIFAFYSNKRVTEDIINYSVDGNAEFEIEVAEGNPFLNDDADESELILKIEDESDVFGEFIDGVFSAGDMNEITNVPPNVPNVRSRTENSAPARTAVTATSDLKTFGGDSAVIEDAPSEDFDDAALLGNSPTAETADNGGIPESASEEPQSSVMNMSDIDFLTAEIEIISLNPTGTQNDRKILTGYQADEIAAAVNVAVETADSPESGHLINYLSPKTIFSMRVTEIETGKELLSLSILENNTITVGDFGYLLSEDSYKKLLSLLNGIFA